MKFLGAKLRFALFNPTFWIFFFLYRIATSYNVDELPVSIITRPASTDRSDVQMGQEVSMNLNLKSE